MDFQRKEGESELNYIIRLVEGKNDGTYDIDYIELFKLAFDVELSSCEARKRYYGIRQLLPHINNDRENNIVENDEIKRLEDKLLEIKKEKYKIQSLRHDLNKTVRDVARDELIFEEILNEIKNVNKEELPVFYPLYKDKGDREYVLSFADSHLGKEFKSITNEYSVDIFYERFNKLLGEVVDIVNEINIKHLHIVALGDLIDGMTLRISQLTKLKIGMTKQTILLMRFIVKWLNELSQYVEITYYSVKSSNHTEIRPFNTKAGQFYDEDMEQITFTYIRDMLSNNSRITVVDSDEKYVMFKVFEYNIIANHGHKIKNVDKFLNDISIKYKIFFDYGFMAHHHHGNIKTVGEGVSGNNNCEIIKVPSIMGSDEYADELFTGAKAGAVLVEFTKNQGKRATYDIILN